MAANRQAHSIQVMCKLYQVTRAGYYAWCQRERSVRAAGDEQLIEQVRLVHEQSRGYYGSPRIAQQLKQQGVQVGRRRVARLMRKAGLQGRSARLYRRAKVGQRKFFASVPNALRDVALSDADQAWVGDVTYLKVAGQWRYMAAVMDRHSRRLVGWSLSRRRDAALTRQALNHAVRKRQPSPGLIFHSDRGIEYAAYEYREQLNRLGIKQSMNRPGKMNDNAHMESFFHSMKTESLHGMSFETDKQLRTALRSYIGFYNQQRLHSSLSYLSPVKFEQQQRQQSCVN
ncbi:IS3 family transposase [Kinneretia aquatilis]|uniref:IS3 family transposase n=1 Tax=Kinneretia aquatilis TaxID=2070761 RepID=UPI002558161F|nr:IS3 family transposase [Paucibacter aquatile]WIW00119.1 IS3 family transposase [Paucibacter aquatile]WIW00180.1 IS3 family transposase [Paucibacter aquatile]WIW00181.1 IS3 family transposase [Paucibacter aquatile]WIW00183.1 IS3 family transposase [Paucibacter aquatile]WIW00200.1 IS3 family transposase [Paucibacter aquatile]